MNEKAIDALRIGLEDSYWYGDDDEKVFNELVRKAKAFDEIMREWENERMTKSHILDTIQKFYDHFERNI